MSRIVGNCKCRLRTADTENESPLTLSWRWPTAESNYMCTRMRTAAQNQPTSQPVSQRSVRVYVYRSTKSKQRLLSRLKLPLQASFVLYIMIWIENRVSHSLRVQLRLDQSVAHNSRLLAGMTRERH